MLWVWLWLTPFNGIATKMRSLHSMLIQPRAPAGCQAAAAGEEGGPRHPDRGARRGGRLCRAAAGWPGLRRPDGLHWPAAQAARVGRRRRSQHCNSQPRCCRHRGRQQVDRGGRRGAHVVAAISCSILCLPHVSGGLQQDFYNQACLLLPCSHIACSSCTWHIL